MFKRLHFGSVRGIPITASASWLVVVFVMLLFVSKHITEISNVSQTGSVLWAALTVLLFFVSIVAHELGHAFAALRAGLKVDGIDLWMFGGFARLREVPRTPGEQLRIAIAGPLVTLLLAVLFLGGISLLHEGGLADASTSEKLPPAVATALLIGLLNVAVLILNVLPAYPLDGGVIARAVAWKVTGDPHRATRYAALAGLGVGALMMAGGLVVFTLDPHGVDGISIAMLGWLVAIAARGSFDSARRQERLDTVTVGVIADPTVSAVDGTHTVLSATDQGGPPGSWVVVRTEGEPPRLLSAAAIAEALAKGQPALTLGELAAESGDRTIDGDTPLRDLIADPRMRDGSPLLALGTEGQPLGIVTGNMLRQAVALTPRPR